MAEFVKKRITNHAFPPPLKMWGRKVINLIPDEYHSQVYQQTVGG